MRHDHQQTMDFCNRLGLHPSDQPDTKLASPSYPVATVDKNYILTTDNHSSLAGDLITANFDDQIRPPFRARRAPSHKHVPVGSPCQKETRKYLSEQLENERQQMREYVLDRYLASLSDEDCWKEDRTEEPLKHTKTRHSLTRSSSLSKLVDSGWRYRVTVPKPFKMTVRESQKVPTKSKSSADFEWQRARQKCEEELECSMKFKASPAPATIYVPLYEEMAAAKERRRRQNLALRQKEHAAMQRPFTFERREDERLAEKQRRHTLYTEADARAPDANFKAKPFPYHLFSRENYKRMCEKEEVKEWQRTVRSEKLLKTSSLPKNMLKKRPSHTCDMTSEQDGCAASESGI